MHVARAAIVTGFVSATLAATGCAGGSGPALDLELVQDPNVNTSAQVLARVDTVTVVVDSEEGLYGPDDAMTSERTRIANWDSDDALEIIATIPVDGNRLPRVRLEQGGLTAPSLHVRVIGYAEDAPDEAVALGGARGLSFGDGVEPVTIPFNLRSKQLPPRVTEIIPGDGDEIQGCSIGVLGFVFSKPVQAGSVLAAGCLAVGGAAPAEIRVEAGPEEGTTQVAHAVVEGLGGEDELRYRVRVGTGVLDTRGRALDQIPGAPGPQPYDEEHVHPCGPPPALPRKACGEPGPEPPYCPGRLQCVDGVCVPTDCEGARCPDGWVCDPASGACAVDCRIYGAADVCPEGRPVCSENGYCRAE